MRKYSAIDLIGNEILFLDEQSFIDKIFSRMEKKSHVYLNIALPEKIFFRLKMLANQISDECENWEIEYQYIVDVLLEDFVRFIQKHNKPLETHKYMSSIASGYELQHYRIGKRFIDDNVSFVTVKMKFERKHILRLEVELMDLDDLNNEETNLTVEKVMSDIIISFINNVRAGRGNEVITNIVKLLNREDE